MIKPLLLAVFMVASASAREYKDPSKKQKNGLLEVGQTPPAQVVDAPAAAVVASPAADERSPGVIQYCGCVNLLKLLNMKKDMTEKLIRDDVLEDSNWEIRRGLNKNVDDAEAAVKKAAYKHEIDRTEVECNVMNVSYKKISAMKEDIQTAVKECNLVEI